MLYKELKTIKYATPKGNVSQHNNLFQGCVSQERSKSFAALKSFSEDPLAECKLSFPISVCKSVDIFLVHYQTDAPLIHVLILINFDLVDIVTRVAKRVVKLDMLDKRLKRP